jgi:hypothetical protein
VNGILGAENAKYHSFLLRLWQVPIDGDLAWRILLENVQSGEKRGFASTEELFAFIRLVTAQEGLLPGEGS